MYILLGLATPSILRSAQRTSCAVRFSSLAVIHTARSPFPDTLNHRTLKNVLSDIPLFSRVGVPTGAGVRSDDEDDD